MTKEKTGSEATSAPSRRAASRARRLRARWQQLKKAAERSGQNRSLVRALPGAQPRPRFEPPAHVEKAPWENGQENQDGTAQASPQDSTEYRIFTLSNPVLIGFMLTTGVGAALLCWWVMTNVGALSGWVVGALFIALGLDPVVRWLERVGIPRVAGVLIVVVTFALVVVGLLSWVIPKVATQTVQLVEGFPTMFEHFLNTKFFIAIDEQFGVRSWVDHEVQDGFSQLTSDSNVVSGFLNNLVNAGSTVASIITGTLIVIFLSLYFLSSLPMMKAWLVRLTPASRRDSVAMLTEKITGSVGNYVMGQAIVALCNATFALLVMLIIDVPFPQLLALFVMILAFIPLVGGVSAGILVSIISLLESWQTAALFAACYFIYLQVEAYFISPRIMSKAVAVPGGIAIIAVAAGGALWGVLGALIAIPVAASLLILVQEVLVPRQDRS